MLLRAGGRRAGPAEQLMKKLNLFLLCLPASVALAAAIWNTTRVSDLSLGEAVYKDTCAARHGASLEGQPDWQSPGPDGRLPAPPHD